MGFFFFFFFFFYGRRRSNRTKLIVSGHGDTSRTRSGYPVNEEINARQFFTNDSDRRPRSGVPGPDEFLISQVRRFPASGERKSETVAGEIMLGVSGILILHSVSLSVAIPTERISSNHVDASLKSRSHLFSFFFFFFLVYVVIWY